MKILTPIVLVASILCVSAQAAQTIVPKAVAKSTTNGLFLPIIASPDASPELVTGFNVYVHCPGCPNMEQVGTNIPVTVWAPATNYFKLSDTTPLGSQIWATQVMIDGTETALSNMVTNFYTLPPVVLKPVRK